MSNISKDFVTKNGIIVRGTSIVTGLTSQTNALQVDSGAAIAKNLIVGSTATLQGLVLTTNTSNAISTTTASVVFSGGLAVAKDIRIGGTLYGLFDGVATTATNLAGGTGGQIVYQVSPGITGFTGPGLFGEVLTSSGSGSAPIYVSTTTLYVGRALLADNSAGTANFANNLNGGNLGEIPYQTGTNATGFIGTGTVGSLLQMGANTASFVTTSTIQVGFAANILAGAGGSIPYQSAANTTAMLGIGANKSILVSNGSVPSWTINPTIGGNVIIEGNLTVQGTTTQVDSTVTNVTDPILTLALGPGGTTPLTDDGKDRGIAFAWTGTQAGLDTGRIGFFGFDRSTRYFTFITSASITNEVVTPAGGTARGAIDANLAGGTAGQLIYQSAADTTDFVGPGTLGQVLISNGASGPLYQSTLTVIGNVVRVDSPVGVSSTITGALQVLNGGVAVGGGLFVGGVSTFTNTLIVNNATGVHSTVTGALQVLNGGLAVGGGLFIGGTVTATTFIGAFSGSADRANSLNGGRLGEIPYQVASSSTAFIGTGTQGSILQMGANTATFVTTANIYVNSAVNAQTLFGGTAGQLHYQSAPGVTAFAGPGSFGQVLISNGVSGPLYQSTLTVGTFVAVDSSLGVSSTITGALRILNGGVAVGGGLFVGGVLTATNLSIVDNATGVHSTITGALRVLNGGAAVGGGLFVGGTVTATTFVGTFSGTADRANNLSGGLLGQIPYQLAPNSTAFIGTGTIGSILQMGANTATFVTTANIYVNSAVNSQNIFGGTAGQLHYQSAPGVTAFAGPGTAGQLLVSAGTLAPVYTNTTTIQVGFAANLLGGSAGQFPFQTAANATSFVSTSNIYVNNAVNADTIRGGTAGQLVYQSAPGVTAFAGPGTAGQVLTSGGTGAPTYVTTTTLYVGRAVEADVVTGPAQNLQGGRLGEIPYQTAPNATAFIGTGTQGSLLQMGANTATFVTSGTVQVGFAANLLAGAGGSIPYQSAANSTAMLGIGGNNSILVSNGSVPSWTINPTIGGNVTIVGNLTVQGTTTQVDSTVTNVSDPIITVGTGPNNTLPLSDDGKDRGIAFAWTGTQAGLNIGRTGFFGFDRSTLYFTFITSASITNEVVAPAGGTTRGAIDANLAGGTTGQLVYQSAANTTAFVGPGTAGQILVSAGAAAPVYTNTGSIYVGFSNQTNNLLAGTAGQLVYQSAPGTTAFAGPGTFGQFLMSNGTGAPLYQSTLTQSAGSIIVTSNNGSSSTATGALRVVNGGLGVGGGGFFGGIVTATSFSGSLSGTASLATDVAGGTAGQLLYQIGTNDTGFVGPGTAGQVLISGGTGAPNYQSTLTVDASVVNVNSTVASTSTTTGALIVDGGVGVAGSVYVGNRVGFVNTGNFSVVYQVYNPVTNSLDTVFG